MYPRFTLALATLGFFAAAAHADSFALYNLDGQQTSLGCIPGTCPRATDGTAVIDTTTGVVATVSYDGHSSIASQTGTALVFSDGSELGFSPGKTLTGYVGGTFGFSLPDYSSIFTGTATEATAPALPTSVTPEPESVVLLGTGLMGLAGGYWRKKLRRFV